MRLLCTFALNFLFVLGTVHLASGTSIDDSELSTTDCNFGEVYAFSQASCIASIRNDGTEALNLTIKSVESGNRVEPSEVQLSPHASTNLALHVQTDNIAGSIAWSFRIDGLPSGPRFVKAEGFVNSIIDEGHPALTFKSIDESALPVSQSLSLKSSIDPDFRVQQVLYAPAGLTVKIGTDGESIVASTDKDAPWGYFDDFIKLSTNSERQKNLWIAVNGSVVGDVAPSTNPYWLGEIPWGQGRGLRVTLLDRNERDFSIGRVSSSTLSASYDSASCEPKRAGCRDLRIYLSDSQPPGLFKSDLDIALSDRNKHLHVQVFGVLLDRPEPGESGAQSVVQKVTMPSTPAVDGVRLPPPTKVLPDPPGRGPLLKWTIAQQDGVHGFQIFRGDAPEGPFRLASSDLIAKVENGSGPVAYRWRDTTAVIGQAYWYYIAALSTSGDRQALSPPHKAVAK